MESTNCAKTCLCTSARYAEGQRRHLGSETWNFSLVLLGILSIALLLNVWGASVEARTVIHPWGGTDRLRFATNRSLSQLVTSGVSLGTEDATIDKAPQHLSLLNVDLSNPNVRLGVVQAHQKLFSSGEPISSMAARTGAVAGINGDFFEIYGTGAPLGIVESQGKIWQSPVPRAMLGVTASGRLIIGTETFVGSVTVGRMSHVLHSVNRYADLKGNSLALFTPALGAALPLSGDSVAFLQPVQGSSNTFQVQSVQASSHSLPVLKNTWALVGAGSASQWLRTTLKVGNPVAIAEHLTPDRDLVQALGGGSVLIRNGKLSSKSRQNAANEPEPLTAIGISKDGRKAQLVVCNGHQPLQKGMTRVQMANYLLAHGAYQAMLFDGGGSSEIVARLPGEQGVSVINNPSDGHERPVSNGLFVYTQEKEPGPVATVAVNGGQPLTLLAGTSEPVQTYALDALKNPVNAAIRLHIEPENLATVSQGIIHASFQTGRGLLVAEVGNVRTELPLTIVRQLATLAVTPANPKLEQGQNITFHVTGTAAGGSTVPLPVNAVSWHVSPPELGIMHQDGQFTASISAVTVGSVTATIGGVSAIASVAVGDSAELVTSMTDLEQWGVSDHYMNFFPRTVISPAPRSIATGSIAFSSTIRRLSSDAGSMQLHYHFSHGQKVFHLDPYPNDPNSFQISLHHAKQPPDAFGIWVRGNQQLVTEGRTTSATGALSLSIGYYESDNTPFVLHMGTITSDGWVLVKAQLPQGLRYPLRVNYVSIVVVDPSVDKSGELYLSDLQAFYPPEHP